MAERVGVILLELIERHSQVRLELDFTGRVIDLVPTTTASSSPARGMRSVAPPS
jgi:hypothetical protein